MKQRDILLILVPAFLITVLWVIFSVYHNYVTSTIKDPLTYQIIPIDGSFNMEGINKIKSRKNYTPIYTAQDDSQALTTLTPIPTVEEEIIIDEELSVTPNPSSSPSRLSPTPTEEIILEEEPVE